MVIVLAVRSAKSEPDMDQRSYEKGYHAFGDAYLPVTDEDRAADEEQCEDLWGQSPSEKLTDVIKADWVAGCADYVEGKDSPF